MFKADSESTEEEGFSLKFGDYTGFDTCEKSSDSMLKSILMYRKTGFRFYFLN